MPELSIFGLQSSTLFWKAVFRHTFHSTIECIPNTLPARSHALCWMHVIENTVANGTFYPVLRIRRLTLLLLTQVVTESSTSRQHKGSGSWGRRALRGVREVTELETAILIGRDIKRASSEGTVRQVQEADTCAKHFEVCSDLFLLFSRCMCNQSGGSRTELGFCTQKFTRDLFFSWIIFSTKAGILSTKV